MVRAVKVYERDPAGKDLQAAEVESAPPKVSETTAERASPLYQFSQKRNVYDPVQNRRKRRTGIEKKQINKELISLSLRFGDLERINRKLWDKEDRSFWFDLIGEQTALAAKICTFHLETLDEFRVVARALVGWAASTNTNDIDDLNGCDAQILSFLFESLIADGGPPAGGTVVAVSGMNLGEAPPAVFDFDMAAAATPALNVQCNPAPTGSPAEIQQICTFTTSPLSPSLNPAVYPKGIGGLGAGVVGIMAGDRKAGPDAKGPGGD